MFSMVVHNDVYSKKVKKIDIFFSSLRIISVKIYTGITGVFMGGRGEGEGEGGVGEGVGLVILFSAAVSSPLFTFNNCI